MLCLAACRCSSLTGAPAGQEWWEAVFELPKELFKFDYVVMDKNTGGVDNNRARVRAGGLGCLFMVPLLHGAAV